jgi:hypothetical protein
MSKCVSLVLIGRLLRPLRRTHHVKNNKALRSKYKCSAPPGNFAFVILFINPISVNKIRNFPKIWEYKIKPKHRASQMYLITAQFLLQGHEAENKRVI